MYVCVCVHVCVHVCVCVCVCFISQQSVFRWREEFQQHGALALSLSLSKSLSLSLSLSKSLSLSLSLLGSLSLSLSLCLSIALSLLCSPPGTSVTQDPLRFYVEMEAGK